MNQPEGSNMSSEEDKEESLSSSSSNDIQKERTSSSSSSTTSSSSSSSWFDNTSNSISSYITSPLLVWKEKLEELDDKQRIDRLQSCQVLDEILKNCRQRYQSPSSTTRKHKKKPKSNKPKSIHDDEDDPIESVSIGIRNMKYFGWRGILSNNNNPNTRGIISNDNNNNNNNNMMITTTNNESTEDNTELSPDEREQQHKQQQILRHQHDLSEIVNPVIRQSCSREQHAVWACRSIATGCGDKLAHLKQCFHKEEEIVGTANNSELPSRHYRILTVPYTNYEGILEQAAATATAATTATDAAGGVTTTNSSSAAATATATATILKQQIPCSDFQRQLGSCVNTNATQLLQRKQQREKQQQQQQQE